MSRPAARGGAALTGLTLGLVLTVCGDSGDSAIEAVAGDLLEATSTGDGQAACEMLSLHTRDELEQSSGKPCDRSRTASRTQSIAPSRCAPFPTQTRPFMSSRQSPAPADRVCCMRQDRVGTPLKGRAKARHA